MSATVQGLFAEAQAELDRQPADAAASVEAATVIGHCGRGLTQLGLDYEPGYRRMAQAAAHMAAQCHLAGATWPAATGRAVGLAGAAVDVLASATPTLSGDERWAAAVAIARVARSCAERARLFPPYEAVPQLCAVTAAATDLQQAAMLYPPTLAGRTVLDRSVPVVRPATQAAPVKAAEDAVAALAAAVHSRVARRELTMRETLTCATVMELASHHAVTVASALGIGTSTGEPWRATAAAWRAVQRACAPFDDGTKATPSTESPVIAWAARLERALAATFPAGPLGSVDEFRGSPDLARYATGMRMIANHAPDIAGDLGQGVARRAAAGHLLARERNLPSYESPLDAAFATNRVVLARGRDLRELAVAFTDARRLSMSLARELDRSSGVYGHQTHPELAAEHAARSTRPGDLAVLRVTADRAQHGAAAVAGPAQWSFIRRERGQHRAR